MATRRRSYRLSPLRAVPITVLSTLVVAAVATRQAGPIAGDSAGGRAPAAAGAANATGFDAPLRGPAPPPSADVASGAARMQHGGPRRTHRAAARGPRKVKVGFRAEVGGPVAAQVTASPDEQVLYVATLGGRLVALSRADGEERWSVDLGDRAYAAPLVGEDGTIYVGSDAKRLVALTPAGKTLFRLETDGEADTSPVFGEDGTIVFAAGRHVYALRRGGDLAWRYSARRKVFTAPAVTPSGLVVVGSQDRRVHAIGPGGELAWSVPLGSDVDGAPAVSDDGAIYVGTDGGEIVRLDEEGTIVWRTPVLGFVRGSVSIARNGDVLAGTYGPAPRVVRIAPDGVVKGAFAIRGTGAREFGIHGSPLEDEGGVLYFGTQDDAAYAIAPDGAQLWRYETGADVDAPLTMLSDGSLVVPSEDGTVTLLLP